MVVHDLFGRPVNQKGIILVDWEGQIANPVMKYYVSAPEGSYYPVRVESRATDLRLYFDLPSETGPRGPKKSVIIREASEEFNISIFPDRDTANEKP